MESNQSPWFVYGQEFFNLNAAISAHVLEADASGEFGYKLVFPNRELEFRGCATLKDAIEGLRDLIGPVRKDMGVWEPNKIQKMLAAVRAARSRKD